VVLEAVLCASNAFEIVIIQPEDTCVVIAGIPNTAIHLASIDVPRVCYDIQVGLCDMGGDVGIQKSGMKH
jgi:hypothetical protein